MGHSHRGNHFKKFHLWLTLKGISQNMSFLLIFAFSYLDVLTSGYMQQFVCMYENENHNKKVFVFSLCHLFLNDSRIKVTMPLKLHGF